VSYIKGSENTFADFMSRRPGENDKALDYEAEIPAWREYSISDDSPIRIFVPFWNNSQFPDKLQLTASTVHKISVKTITAPKTIPLVSANFSNLSEFQLQDSALSKIIKVLESGSGKLDERFPKLGTVPKIGLINYVLFNPSHHFNRVKPSKMAFFRVILS